MNLLAWRFDHFLLRQQSQIYTYLNHWLLKYRIGITNYYRGYGDDVLLALLRKLKSHNDMLLSTEDALQIYHCAKSCLKIRGDFVEIGVYKGSSAILIAEAIQGRKLYLFDTFSGLPKPGKQDKNLAEGDFEASLEFVKNILSTYQSISFYKGTFPHNAQILARKKLAFVHLDVDLYQSTKNSLTYVYPRMQKGGMILTHDYPYVQGVKQAFDEFFSKKPEAVIQIGGNQAMVIKS